MAASDAELKIIASLDDQVSKSIQKLLGEVGTLSDEAKKAFDDMRKAADGAAKAADDTADAAGDVAKETKKAGKEGKEAGESLSKGFAEAALQMVSVSAIIGTVTQKAREFLDEYGKVEVVLARIQAGLDLTSTSTERLKDDLTTLALSVKRFATEEEVATAAQTLLNEKFATTADVVFKVADAAAFARVQGISLTEATKLLVDANGAFAQSSNNSVDVLSKLRQVQKETASDLRILAAGFDRIGNTAQASGVRLEDLLAAFTVLRGAGTSEAESLRFLEGILQGLQINAEVVNQKFAVLGQTFNAQSVSTKGLSGTINTLFQAIQAGGGDVQEEFKKIFGSQQAVNAALALGVDRSSDYSKALSNLSNAASQYNRDLATIGRTQDSSADRFSEFFDIIDNVRVGIGRVSGDFDEFGRRYANYARSQATAGQEITRQVSALQSRAAAAGAEFDVLARKAGESSGVIADKFAAARPSIEAFFDTLSGKPVDAEIVKVQKFIDALRDQARAFSELGVPEFSGAELESTLQRIAALEIQLVDAVYIRRNELADKALANEKARLITLEKKQDEAAKGFFKALVDEDADADIARISSRIADLIKQAQELAGAGVRGFVGADLEARIQEIYQFEQRLLGELTQKRQADNLEVEERRRQEQAQTLALQQQAELQAYQANLQRIRESAALARQLIEEGVSGAGAQVDFFGNLATQVQPLADEILVLEGKLANSILSNEERDEVVARIQSIRDQIRGVGQEAVTTGAAFDAGFTGALEKFVKETANRFKEATDLASAGIQSFQSSFSGFLNDIVLGSKKASDAFKDFIRNFISGIVQAINQLIALKIAAAILTAIGFAGGAAGGANASQAAELGGFTVGEKGGVMPGQMQSTIPAGSSLASMGTGKPMGGASFFADGGVMPGKMLADATGLPLKAYARGGVTTEPQIAVFGEGRGAEAFVPLPGPNRGIPVEFQNRPELDFAPLLEALRSRSSDISFNVDVPAPTFEVPEPVYQFEVPEPVIELGRVDLTSLADRLISRIQPIEPMQPEVDLAPLIQALSSSARFDRGVPVEFQNTPAAMSTRRDDAAPTAPVVNINLDYNPRVQALDGEGAKGVLLREARVIGDIVAAEIASGANRSLRESVRMN